MKNNDQTTDRAEVARRDLIATMEDELASTIAAYESLLKQCRKLADSMGYNGGYVIGKVMPKTLADRTDLDRISDWFEVAKKDAADSILRLEAEREQNRERERLLASLNLTPDQKALLGID